MIDQRHGWNVSFKAPTLGFVLSLLLTMAAYRLVTQYHLPPMVLVISLLGLGVAQAVFQLIFFLHLGLGSKPHWHMITFFFMVLVVLIVVGGTMWIMENLNYNMMPMDMKGH